GTYQVEGLDLSDRIISFDDLGGIWKTTADVTIAEEETLNTFKSMGDYQIEMGDLIPEGSVLTFDVSGLTEFVDQVEDLKPKRDLLYYIFDYNKLRYRLHTKGMLKQPFYTGEFD